jgi:hypothetical protein
VACRHKRIRGFLEIDHTVEDLLVVKHPESVEQQKNWRITEHLDGVVRQLIIEGGWKAIGVRHMVLFVQPENAVGKYSDWEKDWQSQPIHHCDIRHVQNTRVLEVNDVVRAAVKFDVLTNLGFLRGVGELKSVFFPRLIHSAG